MKKNPSPSPRTNRLLLELGANIRLARLRRGLSIRVIAERAGVSSNTIVSLERGSPGVSIGIVTNVLHTLGLAEDIAEIARDDSLGRKLQDLELLPRKRAPRRKKMNEENKN